MKPGSRRSNRPTNWKSTQPWPNMGGSCRWERVRAESKWEISTAEVSETSTCIRRLQHDHHNCSPCWFPLRTGSAAVSAGQPRTLDRRRRASPLRRKADHPGRRLLPAAARGIVEGPSVASDGDNWLIRFQLDEYDDVLLRIRRRSGNRRSTLGCGVLGPNAPEPFQKNSLRQTVAWDGKDSEGEDASRDCRVQLSVGLVPVSHVSSGTIRRSFRNASSGWKSTREAASTFNSRPGEIGSGNPAVQPRRRVSGYGLPFESARRWRRRASESKKYGPT